MEEIYKKARAKINLNLEIVGKREDNYHNIRSIFQKINLYDELWIKKMPTNEIEIESNVEELNTQKNIIYQAYKKLKENDKNITGVQVKLKKKIPMQAGLGGGSTDCASFLLGMKQLFNLKLTRKEIEEIGSSLGADVVPCFYNRALLAEGIGDKISLINTHFTYYLIIIKPELSCSTKELYRRIDERKKIIQPQNSKKIIQALEQEKIEQLGCCLYNIFEEVMVEKENANNIKKELIKNGAIRKFNDWFRFLYLWYI